MQIIALIMKMLVEVVSPTTGKFTEWSPRCTAGFYTSVSALVSVKVVNLRRIEPSGNSTDNHSVLYLHGIDYEYIRINGKRESS
jgi:hypothetical protein